MKMYYCLKSHPFWVTLQLLRKAFHFTLAIVFDDYYKCMNASPPFFFFKCSKISMMPEFLRKPTKQNDRGVLFTA